MTAEQSLARTKEPFFRCTESMCSKYVSAAEVVEYAATEAASSTAKEKAE